MNRIWHRHEHGGKKQSVAVLELVTEAPATSRDIADALAIPLKTASATLKALHDQGLLTRKLLVTQTPGQQAYLYAVPPTNHLVPRGTLSTERQAT